MTPIRSLLSIPGRLRAAILALFVASALSLPAEDLTVTVRENANGSTTFTLSGTSKVVGGYSMLGLATNFSAGAEAVPPLSPLVTSPLFIPVPEGLTLTYDSTPSPVGVFIATTYLGPTAFRWFLAAGGPLPVDSVSGSGTVTIPDFPFFLLKPGTFVVEPGGVPDSAPEVAEAASESAVGVGNWRTIYKVIPHDRKATLSGQAPRVLSAPEGGRASGEIRITNSGNVPLENLEVSAASRDFRLGAPARTRLDPGQSTTCPVTFFARRGRSASVMVSLSAKTPDRTYSPSFEPTSEPEDAAPEEDSIEGSPIVVPGEIVKSKVKVRGEVKSPLPNSPRFPRGPFSPR